MQHTKTSTPLAIPEFVALIAMLTSLTALAIDAMLPALPQIAQTFALSHANEAQLIIPVLFLGMSIGQFIVGPLSDSYGRKVLIYIGLTIFFIGSLISALAQDYNTLLIGRFLQGLGTAAPRIITTAIIRDCYSGRAMARIMSLSFIIFMIVPAIAPAIGQGIMYFTGWRSIFLSFLILSVIAGLWFHFRQPETLPPEKRQAFTWAVQWRAIKVILSNKVAMGYTLATGLIFGAFLGYLSLAQPILQDQYALGSHFPLYFALLSIVLGIASFINAKMVIEVGMRYLALRALLLVIVVAVAGMALSLGYDGHPPLILFLIFCAISFMGVGILFSNLNALIMEPLGDNAGLGASITGSISTLISIPLGALIGLSYDASVTPLVLGFLVLNTVALLTFLWTRHQMTD